jgi:hypothetical protein
MINQQSHISRRQFLKRAFFSSSALLLNSYWGVNPLQSGWPDAEQLGRVLAEPIKIRMKPSTDSQVLKELKFDDVVVWLREVIGEVPNYSISSRWVETPEGYIYAANLQPIRSVLNTPLDTLPSDGNLTGMWAEVTVPYVSVKLEKAPVEPWLKESTDPRLYYSQILWIDGIRQGENGKPQYRINEKYSRGDLIWADAEAFRPLTGEDIAPINPEVEEKNVIVNLFQNTLSCFEGKREVYFCKVSPGLPFDENYKPVPISATPVGYHPIWRKMVSTHMEGGTAGGGFDLPGVAWTSLFAGTGEAIHSTYWHNDFGAKRSHGCVNCTPEDAKWIFRWTSPIVDYYPGEKTVEMPGGTTIQVIEG